MFTTRPGSDVSQAVLDAIRQCSGLVTEIKVGQIVVPNTGPHAGQRHKVKEIHESGKYVLQPMEADHLENKYRYGVTVASKNDFDTLDQLKEETVDESRKYHGGYTSYSHKEVLQKVRDGEWEAHGDVTPNKLIDVTPYGKKRKMIHIHEDAVDEGRRPRLADHDEWGHDDEQEKRARQVARRIARKRKELMDEQVVTELSTDLLNRYRRAAHSAAPNHADIASRARKSAEHQRTDNSTNKYAEVEDKIADQHEKKASNRIAGYKKATVRVKDRMGLHEGFKNYTFELQPGQRTKVINGDYKGTRATVVAKHDHGAVYELKHDDGKVMKHHISTLSEEVIQELSKATLGRYIKKAAGQVADKEEARKEIDRKTAERGKEWEKKYGMKQGKGSMMDPPAHKKSS